MKSILGGVVVGLVFAFPAVAAADDEGVRADRPVDPASPAVNAAYAAFSEWLAGRDESGGDQALARFALDIRNYDIWMSQSGSRYFIEFRLKRMEPFQNVVGGGSKYVIRKRDNVIERAEHSR
ncbi:hypothetical protein E2F46_10085 [Luteimonas aestuarii]|uniref:Uncharacterized protein n=1 Tax=Luteimonas aestuarii TaxID=453837 RepID=A0A4R5TP76_9GAMM|nr:hypothetical protein [Luteimonas aestuarii]TDK23866.1 hypothetical protein E2F46_10085 [Luteimonas aestuarii]